MFNVSILLVLQSRRIRLLYIAIKRTYKKEKWYSYHELYFLIYYIVCLFVLGITVGAQSFVYFLSIFLFNALIYLHFIPLLFRKVEEAKKPVKQEVKKEPKPEVEIKKPGKPSSIESAFSKTKKKSPEKGLCKLKIIYC